MESIVKDSFAGAVHRALANLPIVFIGEVLTVAAPASVQPKHDLELEAKLIREAMGNLSTSAPEQPDYVDYEYYAYCAR